MLHRHLKSCFLILLLLAVCMPGVSLAQTFKGCARLDDPLAYRGREGFRFLVAGQDGWIFRHPLDFKDDFELTDKTRQSLKAFADYLQDRGTTLIVVAPPTRALLAADAIDASSQRSRHYNRRKALYSYRDMIGQLKDAGIVAVDLTRGPQGDGFFSRRDIHWTHDGADYAAKAVADEMRRRGLLKGLDRVSYRTAAGPEQQYTGSLGRIAADICKDEIPDETARSYTTMATGRISRESLFGDRPRAGIVLAGTSFSTLDRANFDGALRERIGADVRNVAVGGGGAGTSILDYLASPDFRSAPPKILIWEVPAHYNLNDPDLQAQLAPSALGECFGYRLMGYQGEDRLDANNLLKDIAPIADMPQGKIYVHVAMKDKIPDDLTLGVDYDNDKETRFDLVSSKRMARQDFYVEFPATPAKAPRRVFLQTASRAPLKAEARICAYPPRQSANYLKVFRRLF